MLANSGVIAGIISHIGLRLRRPMIDDLLSAADLAMRVSTPSVVLAFSEHPLTLQLLAFSYSSVLPLCFVSVLYLSVNGRASRTWEAVASFSCCIIVASLIGAFYPAIGNFAHANLKTATVLGFPPGSGVYHLPVFNMLYRGNDPVFDLAEMNGVVTFPSFHLVMALIFAWAMRQNGLISWAAILWSATIVVSTIPIGGHYIIDLYAGLILWAATVATIHLAPVRICQPMP